MRIEPYRVALIGYGHIGRALYESLSRDPQRFDVAGVFARDSARLDGVPPPLRFDSIEQLLRQRPDLVIEAVHPDITREWGTTILEVADYLPVSLSALADIGRFEQLQVVARTRDSRLLVPHGAVVGADSLVECSDLWEDVEIEFRKNPRNINFTHSGARVPQIEQSTIVFEGTVRQIALRFPLNVNAMVACALMTVGLDRCRARLVADPGTNFAHLRIVARGRDGAVLDLRREQPVVGVSGTEMARSILLSVRRACSARASLDFI